MPQRDTIVLGASAGGVEALRTVLLGLPRDLAAVVLIVLHTPPSGVNALAVILSRCTELSVASAADGLPMRPGSVIVARPDHHLVVHDGEVMATRGPRENGHRPAVDVLFRSAARALGPRVIGVVLSGALDDGSAGLITIRARGGIGIVQDPEDAVHAGMPSSAIAAAAPEHVLPVAEIPKLLVDLAGTEIPAGDLRHLRDPAAAPSVPDHGPARAEDRTGEPSGLSCPACHGTLFGFEEGRFLQYRCRFGHAWSPQSLLAENDTALEGALWMALRSLEEKASLTRRMAEQVRAGGHRLTADRFEDQAGEARQSAELLRRMLLEGIGIIRGADE